MLRNSLLRSTIARHSLVRLKSSYDHGLSPTPLVYQTISKTLRKAVEHSPGEEFVVFRHQNVRKTYEEVYNDARQLAAGLVNLGLTKGDRVGIWGPNYYEWVTTQMATAMAGIIQVNVNPAYRSNELRFALEKVGVRALITPKRYKSSKYLRILHEILPQLVTEGRDGVGFISQSYDSELRLEHLIVFGEEKPVKGAWSYNDIITSAGSNAFNLLDDLEKSLSPDDPINIQYTSGTTGNPKAATLTHHNILNNAYFTGRACNYHLEKHSICIPNPLYHCFGCVLGVSAALVHKQKCVFPSATFNAKKTLEAIHEEKCTDVYGTPTMFIDALDHPERTQLDLDSLKGGIIAGSPCPRVLCERMVTEMGMKDMVVVYGSTELSPAVTVSSLEKDPLERVTNVGYTMPHAELVVVDESGQAVPRGVKGELLARGYMLMREYWGDEEKTKKEITKDRWYHTGDTAIMNEDGSIRIVGRTKDMIIRGGENIYPTEIEQFLFGLPYVADAQVIGVPDERLGEAVCVWIRLREDAGEVVVEDIQKECKEKLAHFKVPKYILIKEEKDFPLTATGKVQKYVMREISKRELGLDQLKSHFNE